MVANPHSPHIQLTERVISVGPLRPGQEPKQRQTGTILEYRSDLDNFPRRGLEFDYALYVNISIDGSVTAWSRSYVCVFAS